MNESLFIRHTNSATNFRFLVLRKFLLVNTLIDAEQLYLGPTQPLPTSARHMINSSKMIRLRASMQHTILTTFSSCQRTVPSRLVRRTICLGLKHCRVEREQELHYAYSPCVPSWGQSPACIKTVSKA